MSAAVRKLVKAARAIIDGDLDPDMGLLAPGLFHEAAPNWMRDLKDAADEVDAELGARPPDDPRRGLQ